MKVFFYHISYIFTSLYNFRKDYTLQTVLFRDVFVLYTCDPHLVYNFVPKKQHILRIELVTFVEKTSYSWCFRCKSFFNLILRRLFICLFTFLPSIFRINKPITYFYVYYVAKLHIFILQTKNRHRVMHTFFSVMRQKLERIVIYFSLKHLKSPQNLNMFQDRV